VLAFHDHLTLLNLLGLLLAIAGTWLYKITRPRAAGAATGARRTGEGGELSYSMVAQEDLNMEVYAHCCIIVSTLVLVASLATYKSVHVECPHALLHTFTHGVE
jgi:hypothetical protein